MNAQIRAALANVLAAGFPTWSVSKYWQGKVEPPMLDIMTGPIAYDTAMARGNDDITYIIRASVQWTLDESAQAALDSLLDTDEPTTSMKGVVEADRTLGGTVDAIRVVEASEVKVYPSAGSDIVGIEFTCVVTPKNA